MDISGLVSDVTSHAKKLGIFQSVNRHEPKAAPQNGLTCSVWANAIEPIPAVSGLNATSVYVEMSVRVYTSMVQLPYDDIDPKLMSAVDKLMAEYSKNFTLGGDVVAVDLLGSYGKRLAATAGYVEQDKKIYRIMTITLPLIVDHVWTQVP